MGLPEKIFVTQKDVLGSGMGVTRYQWKKISEGHLIKRWILPGCKYGKYLRRDVEKMFGLNRV